MSSQPLPISVFFLRRSDLYFPIKRGSFCKTTRPFTPPYRLQVTVVRILVFVFVKLTTFIIQHDLSFLR